MRPVRLLAAIVLTVVAAVSGSTAHAAPATGELTVTLLDPEGAPSAGSIQVLNSVGDTVQSAQRGSTATFTLDPGAYGVVAITPWGGLVCAGLDPCDYGGILARTILPNGDVTVGPGTTRTTTFQASAPGRIVGKRVVGKPLSIAYSDAMEQLFAVFTMGVGVNVRPSVAWLRDGAPIPGATEATYVPTGADSGRAVSARLTYTGLALTYMQQVIGAPSVPPVTTPAVSVGKQPTKTFIRMVRSTFTTQQHGVVRVDVTAPNAIVTGKVKVSVGHWSETRPLRNGRIALQLPLLKAGGYVVHASYLGSSGYKPSTAKAKRITVTR